MSRRQYLRSGSIVPVPTAGTPIPLSLTDLWVKSVIIQASPSNTDFVYVGDQTAQLQALEPRRSLKIWGDEMDNGGSALINLAEIYIDATVNGEGVSFTYLEGN